MAPTDPLRGQGREIDGIQYLRAVAALMVVAHHARHYFPQGDLWSNLGSRGVDIFFVISGFIMAHSTRGYRADGDRAAQALEFLLKRVIRVVPLYWLALLWTGKSSLFSGAQPPLDVLRDFLFVPHFHRVYTGSIFPYLVPGWTINYEMFFYAIFALSLLLGGRRFRFVAIVLLALVGLGFLDWKSAPAIFYTSSVLLEFLLGVVVYFLTRSSGRVLSRSMLGAILATAVVLLSFDNGDAVRGFADGPFAAVIVWVAVQWPWKARIHWLRSLGDASYSIYLFHLASFWVAGSLLHRAGLVAPTPLGIVVALVVHMATAIAAGLLVHRFVERPLLRFLRRRLPRSNSRAPSPALD
jgi:exopolysaccharide production protein ExoZ